MARYSPVIIHHHAYSHPVQLGAPVLPCRRFGEAMNGGWIKGDGPFQIDEARIRDHLGEMVRGTVEETLNALLDAEADRLCGAGRYERSQGWQDTRAGSYERSLHTVAGEVNLNCP